MKVAFQGEKGAYSEEALYRHFGKGAEALGFDTFDDVYEAVKNGNADCGFLPFENTIAGSIAENYDSLLKEDIFVVAECFHIIRHSLLSKKGSKFEDITKAFSHPHALHQCHEFLRAHKIKPVPEYDTAGAAKIVKKRNKPDEAAIASEFCAEIYGLSILKRDIGADKNTSTKFLVFVKKNNIQEGLKKEKTSIAFKTKHYPGALVNCLQRLSKNGINMTKLESRPIPENPWEYVFYVDFIGGLDDENVKLALSEMETTTSFIKVLGSYPKGRDGQ